MTCAATALLGKRLVQPLDLDQLAFYGFMTFKAEFRHLPDAEIKIIGTVRIMA